MSEPRMDDWATHVPALAACLARTNGAILECGVGIWSTPVLHAYALASDRKLLSLESKADWFSRFTYFSHPMHDLRLIDNWRNGVEDLFVEPFRRYGLVFVDHGEAPRGGVVDIVRGRADIVVMHDSECNYCGYTEALTRFDWAWTHKHSPTWTTVAGHGAPPAWLEEALPNGSWGVPVPYRG